MNPHSQSKDPNRFSALDEAFINLKISNLTIDDHPVFQRMAEDHLAHSVPFAQLKDMHDPEVRFACADLAIEKFWEAYCGRFEQLGLCGDEDDGLIERRLKSYFICLMLVLEEPPRNDFFEKVVSIREINALRVGDISLDSVPEQAGNAGEEGEKAETTPSDVIAGGSDQEDLLQQSVDVQKDFKQGYDTQSSDDDKSSGILTPDESSDEDEEVRDSIEDAAMGKATTRTESNAQASINPPSTNEQDQANGQAAQESTDKTPERNTQQFVDSLEESPENEDEDEGEPCPYLCGMYFVDPTEAQVHMDKEHANE